MSAPTVNVLFSAFVTFFWLTAPFWTTVPEKFVVPLAPLIPLPNVPPLKFIVPAFVIVFVISKLLAFVFTAPPWISISFCVTLPPKLTSPLPLTIVLPFAVVSSLMLPPNVIDLFAPAVNVIVPSLYISLDSPFALLPLNVTSLFSAVIFNSASFHIAPPAVPAVLFVKFVSLNVATPLFFTNPPSAVLKPFTLAVTFPSVS